jgi:hypothetical protein
MIAALPRPTLSAFVETCTDARYPESKHRANRVTISNRLRSQVRRANRQIAVRLKIPIVDQPLRDATVTKCKEVCVSLPYNLLERLDRIAQTTHRSRSAVIRDLLSSSHV